MKSMSDLRYNVRVQNLIRALAEAMLEEAEVEITDDINMDYDAQCSLNGFVQEYVACALFEAHRDNVEKRKAQLKVRKSHFGNLPHPTTFRKLPDSK